MSRKIVSVGGLVLPGFHPDPSVCVHAGEAWMVTSTFEYLPGLPLYSSDDLRVWRARGHAVADTAAFPALATVPSGAGLFAPSLRHLQGEWRLACTLLRELTPEPAGPGRGHFVLSAVHPEGPWSAPRWLAGAPFGIDPDLFADADGEVYLIANRRPEVPLWPQHRVIWLQRCDLAAGRLVGERVELLDPARWHGRLPHGNMNTTEGPRLIRRHGAYFLLVAHGGTGRDHAVSIFASERLRGPYEPCPHNPILTHRDAGTGEVAMVGHGDLFEFGGAWWISALGTRPLDGCIDFLGRETFFAPVAWDDFWPVVNPGPSAGRLPAGAPPAPDQLNWTDRWMEATLHPRWIRRRGTAPRAAAIVGGGRGALQLARPLARLADAAPPGFLGFRQTAHRCRFTVRLEEGPSATGDATGLAVVRDERRHVTWTTERGQTGMCARLRRWSAAGPELLGEMPLGPGPWELGLEARGVNYTFWAAASAGPRPGPLSASLAFLGWTSELDFTGIVIGLYATGPGGSPARFTEARYRAEESGDELVSPASPSSASPP